LKPIQISASILSCDFARLGEEIRKVEHSGAGRIHVDVMDGHFVPNITIGSVIVKAIRPLTKLPIEAHLMIENPSDYINDFAEAGADVIQIQAECYGVRRAHCRDYGQYPKEIDTMDEEAFRRDLKKIQAKGKKGFIVLNPGTPLCFDGLLKEIDGALIMSVNPGFAGQRFMPEVLDKVRSLRQHFSRDIEIDGGINNQTGPEAVKAGVNILVTASYLFHASRPDEAVRLLKKEF